MRLKQDVYQRLQKRLVYECDKMRAARQRMNELSSQYNEYRDLAEGLNESTKRMSYIIGLLGPARFGETAEADDALCLRELSESDAQRQREKLRLWRAIREYLRETPGKSKVGEIEEFLTWIGLKGVTRQAIESALKRHSDWFKVTKQGHERYVELR